MVRLTRDSCGNWTEQEGTPAAPALPRESPGTLGLGAGGSRPRAGARVRHSTVRPGCRAERSLDSLAVRCLGNPGRPAGAGAVLGGDQRRVGGEGAQQPPLSSLAGGRGQTGSPPA